MRYLYTAVVLLLALTAQAQTDSVRTEYQTEDERISKSEIKRFIRYITRADVEEKTLVKVGIWPNAGGLFGASRATDRAGLRSEISMERKISPSVSFLIGANGTIGYVSYERDPTLTTAYPGGLFSTENSSTLSADIKAATRYYYGMAKRIREGRSANHLSANYVVLQLKKPVYAYLRNRLYNAQTGETDYLIYESDVWNRNSLVVSLQWGFQRRLGRIGYVDLNIGPSAHTTDTNSFRFSRGGRKVSVGLEINTFIGLGW